MKRFHARRKGGFWGVFEVTGREGNVVKGHYRLREGFAFAETEAEAIAEANRLQDDFDAARFKEVLGGGVVLFETRQLAADYQKDLRAYLKRHKMKPQVTTLDHVTLRGWSVRLRDGVTHGGGND